MPDESHVSTYHSGMERASNDCIPVVNPKQVLQASAPWAMPMRPVSIFGFQSLCVRVYMCSHPLLFQVAGLHYCLECKSRAKWAEGNCRPNYLHSIHCLLT